MSCNHFNRWRAGKWMVFIGCTLALPAFAEDDKHFSAVIERAQQLAEEAYQAPEETLPEVLRELNYDTYRQIRFDPAHAYWKDESPFSLQLFRQRHGNPPTLFSSGLLLRRQCRRAERARSSRKRPCGVSPSLPS